MKQLTIPEEGQFEIDEYNPALEGFVELVKSLFVKKDEITKRVDGFKKNKFSNGLAEIDKALKEDLSKTYNDPKWVQDHLSNNSGTVIVKNLKLANVDGKAITTPEQLLSVAEGMFKVVDEIAQREKPFIARRIKLIGEICKETDPEVVEKFWSKHSKDLLQRATDRYRQKTKTPTPALGNGYRQKNATWPINFANPKDISFNSALFKETDGSFVAPNTQNAASFVKTITRLLEIDKKINLMLDDPNLAVPYFEVMEFEYNDVDSADDIYSYLTTDQSDCEVMDLVYGVHFVITSIIIGLYIAMFDKHPVNSKPSVGNEGFLDIFKRKDKDAFDNASSALKINLTNKSDLLDKLAKNPEAFRLTNATPKLALSIDGHIPSGDQLVNLLTQTLKSMEQLSNKFKQDALSHAKIAGPLISNFEKAMTDVMDASGNVPQDALDKAMLPIIAAKSQLQRTYYNQFGNDQKVGDHWLSGNPFSLERKKDGSWEDKSHSVKLPTVQMPKITDMNVIKDLLKVLSQYTMSNSFIFFETDGPFDNELDVPSYEFDRPVRHLDQDMNQEQLNAIYTLYTFFDNTAGLYFDICDHADKLLANITTYIYTSVEEVK